MYDHFLMFGHRKGSQYDVLILHENDCATHVLAITNHENEENIALKAR